MSIFGTGDRSTANSALCMRDDSQNNRIYMHDEKDVLTSALDMPEIMLYIYSKSWKLQFSASSSIIIIEDYYLQTFLHSLARGHFTFYAPFAME